MTVNRNTVFLMRNLYLPFTDMCARTSAASRTHDASQNGRSISKFS